MGHLHWLLVVVEPVEFSCLFVGFLSGSEFGEVSTKNNCRGTVCISNSVWMDFPLILYSVSCLPAGKQTEVV